MTNKAALDAAKLEIEGFAPTTKGVGMTQLDSILDSLTTPDNGPKEVLEKKQQLLADILSLDVMQDDNSKHVRRFQCPNYGSTCYDWAEQWKMNSEPPFCSNCGKKMKSVEFDEPEGDDWTKNEFRKELRQALQDYFMGGDVGVDSQDSATPIAHNNQAGNLNAGGTK